MARFFIDRPIFAWVIAIITMGAGLLSILTLPVAQYPEIAPPSVRVSTTYPGASAETVANTVTQLIEERMTGIDNLAYINSSSTSAGTADVTLTFETGTDPDIAQVQVQNQVSRALSSLPDRVRDQGVTVRKASGGGFLIVVALISRDGTLNDTDLADYLNSTVVDDISRISGVGEVRVFGSEYAMRIWLDPVKLSSFNLTPTDVVSAVSEQNTQVSAGSFGALPAPAGQMLNATITAQSLLTTPDDFRQIVLRAETNGGLVLLQDVARVEIGSESYTRTAFYNRFPATGMAIELASGANAIATADAVKARVEELSPFFPEGVEYQIAFDRSPFVLISIEEVVKTLFEAILLVFLIMYLFLQNIRATLIPTVGVPVVLLGTFGVLAAFGFSINTLTMLAMVLSIGLLVDDGIVVVENVERLMEEEGLDPVEATRKSMDQITPAIVGISLVLVAVFVPMAFFGGSTGVIYQQFSITIVSAMLISTFSALTLTPALCATLLKKKEPGPRKGFFGWFNRNFDRVQNGYAWIIKRTVRGAGVVLLLYALMIGGVGWLFNQTPTAFLPEEDQGIMFTLIQGPEGATAERTLDVVRQVEDHFLDGESENVQSMFGVVGFNFAGQGQNMGLAFVRMKDWSERTGPGQSVQAIAGRAFPQLGKIQDARIIPIAPPAVRGLGSTSGFSLYLQAQAGQSHEELLAARNQLMGAAAQSPLIGSVRPNGLQDAAQYNIAIDWKVAGAMGVTASDVADILSIAWSGRSVNDFIDRGRIKKVYVQAEGNARALPGDLDKWRVRNSEGQLVPMSNFATGSWKFGPQALSRYNGIPAMQLQGTAAEGVSTGEAMDEMERLVAELPPGFNVAWTGLSREEKQSGSQAPLLYALSLAAVFLCLAALYESWSIPIAVMLAMPIGVLGAFVAAHLGGLDNGVFFQVALLTVIGLTAKNAILIVEFARDRWESGEPLWEATVDAARQRFRPILMTSMAFILGVLPLVLASGAGAGGRVAIGSGVLGGTLSSTFLGIFFVPLFFVLVGRYSRGKKAAEEGIRSGVTSQTDGAKT